MCYPDPGPRCVQHAKPTWDKARADLEVAKASGDPQKIKEARRKEERARMEYYGTSAGQKELLQRAEQVESKGNTELAERLREFHEECVEYRRNQIGTLKRINTAKNGRPGPAAPPPGFIAQRYSQKSLSASKTPPQRDGSPSTTQGYGISIQPHAQKMADTKGFTEAEIVRTFANPDRIYPSGSHPGQHRITGNGLCLVGEFQGNNFRVVTVYLDGVVTRPRKDQLNTAEGREFDKRYRRYGSRSRDGVRARTV